MDDIVERLKQMPSERRDYTLQTLLQHLAKAADHQRIFELIDDGQFLEAKAKFLDGFRDLSRDVEEFALVAAIEEHDWPRFVHYALLAANLRGLAEELGQEEIILALMRSGRSAFAKDVVDQISDPLQRTRLRAVAFSSSSGEGFVSHGQWGGLWKDLQLAASGSSDEKEAEWLDTLTTITQRLGPQTFPYIEPYLSWLPTLSNEQDRFWLALAKVCRATDNDDSFELFWNALRHVQDPQALIGSVVDLVSAAGADDFRETLDRFSCALDPSEQLFWQAATHMLGNIARQSAQEAWALWEQLAADRPVPWTPELVEASRAFFGRLSSADRAKLSSTISDPVAETALTVIALEEWGETPDPDAALVLIDLIPVRAAQIHWALRLLSACSNLPIAEQKNFLSLVTRCALEDNFCLPAEDARLYLDLVARITPTGLRRHTELIMRSPAAKPECLLEIADRAESNSLLEHLLDNADKYASLVTEMEAQSFGLRRELLIKIAIRLCLKHGRLHWLDQAKEHLLPEEQDDLCVTAATELAAQGLYSLVIPICEDIRSRKRKLVTQLQIMRHAEGCVPGAPKVDDLLDFASLYATMASIETLEDERLSLSALLESPHAPRKLAEEYLDSIVDSECKVYALMDLARHAIAYQERNPDPKQREYESAIQLIRLAADLVSAEEVLLVTTPDLADAASKIGGELAAAEFAEAIERILRFEAVPWTLRYEALLAVLGNIETALFSNPDQPWEQKRLQCKSLAALFDRVLRMPDDPEPDQAREELREHWHQLLPVMVASFERLPPLVWDYIEHPGRAILCDELLGVISNVIGRTRLWTFLDRVERALIPTRLQKHLRPTWMMVRGRWEWLSSRQACIVKLCFVTPKERNSSLTTMLTGEQLEPGVLSALAFLFASKNNTLLQNIVKCMPASSERDQLCFRLIVDRWLPERASWTMVAQLADYIEDDTVRTGAKSAWLMRDRKAVETEHLSDALNELVNSKNLYPADPNLRSVLREMWTEGKYLSSRSVAATIPGRLATGGQHGGQAALCVWLDHYLRPELGKHNEVRLGKSQALRPAIKRALHLQNTEEATEIEDASSTATDKERERLTNLYRSWQAAQKKFYWRFGDTLAESLRDIGILMAMLFGILLVPVDALIFPMGDATAAADTQAMEPVNVAVRWSVLLLLCLINGWLMNGYLTSRTDRADRYKGWVLKLRFALSSLPLLGLYTIPAWQWVLREQPTWAIKDDRGNRLSKFVKRWRRVSTFDSWMTEVRVRMTWIAQWTWVKLSIWWMLLTNFGALIYVLGPLFPNHVEMTPAGLAVTATAVGLLHFVVFSGVFLAFYIDARRMQATGLSLIARLGLSAFWLIPFPGASFLGLMLFALVSSTPTQNKTVLHQAYEGRSALARLPLWLGFEESLRHRWTESSWWQRILRRPQALSQQEEESGEENQRRLLIYKLKIAALVVEAAALTWGLRWLADRWPAVGGATEGFILLSWGLPLLIGSIGLLIVLIQFTIAALRSSSKLQCPPYVLYLTTSQLAFTIGTLVGYCWWDGEYESVFGLLFFATAMILILQFIPTILGIFRTVPGSEGMSLPELLFLIFFAFFILATGLNSGLGEGAQLESALALLKSLALVPLLISLLCLLSVNFFLKPFRTSYTSDLRFPKRMRGVFAFMAISVIAPLGGLAAPLWLYAHHQLWPRYKDFLASLSSEFS